MIMNKIYRYFNEVSRRLYQFLESESGELKCDEDVHEALITLIDFSLLGLY